MRAFADYNPAVVLLSLMSCACIAMFSLNPVIITISLLSAAALWFVRCGMNNSRTHLFAAAVLLAVPFFNMLFSHNGATVLLIVNNNPVTLEALLYGAASAVMLVSVIYWMRTFSQIMTSDKLLYLLGSVSPKLALILSMALRYIPLFGRQARRTDDAQKVLGLYREDNVVDGAKGKLRVFSILVTWALENGIITADSMSARGYAVGRRSSFSLYRFRRSDAVVTALVLLPMCVCCAAMASGALDYSYYPTLSAVPCTPFALTAYICYGIMTLLPTFIELEVRIRWRSLTSAI